MSDLIRCDKCGREFPRRLTSWLRLDRQGLDMRTIGSWEARLPLDFCGIDCLASFGLTTAAEEARRRP